MHIRGVRPPIRVQTFLPIITTRPVLHAILRTFRQRLPVP
ncbi:hypothetical protein AHF37_03270 [Paragonimus kellicotti]|nr:hypothetical protein AHF37_03270 [Paragonimus kellicotti]